jgi:hypothetical protein
MAAEGNVVPVYATKAYTLEQSYICISITPLSLYPLDTTLGGSHSHQPVPQSQYWLTFWDVQTQLARYVLPLSPSTRSFDAVWWPAYFTSETTRQIRMKSGNRTAQFHNVKNSKVVFRSTPLMRNVKMTSHMFDFTPRRRVVVRPVSNNKITLCIKPYKVVQVPNNSGYWSCYELNTVPFPTTRSGQTMRQKTEQNDRRIS